MKYEGKWRKILPKKDDMGKDGRYKGDCMDEKKFRKKYNEEDAPMVPKCYLQKGVRKVTDSEIAEALKKTMGIVNQAVIWLNNEKGIQITPWAVRKRVYGSHYLQKIQKDVSEEIVDIAESKLYKLLKKDDPKAIMFILKTKGKKRGWTEHKEDDAENKESLLPKINISFIGNESPVIDTELKTTTNPTTETDTENVQSEQTSDETDG